MAWLACGFYNDEFIFNYKPHRACVYTSNDEKIEYWKGFSDDSFKDEQIELPNGSIKKLIGKDLTFNDDPVEII